MTEGENFACARHGPARYANHLLLQFFTGIADMIGLADFHGSA